MDRVLSRLRELFLRTHGFDLSEYDDAFVRDTLARRLAELGLPEADAYGSFLAGSDIEAAAFVDALRISYTRGCGPFLGLARPRSLAFFCIQQDSDHPKTS